MNDIHFNRKLVILNGLAPLAILTWDALRGQIGANAVNQALHITGLLSLLFLTLSLAITPLKLITGLSSLVAYRRAFGLFGFGYAAIHFGIYVLWDRAGSLGSTVEELLSRRFLQVGFASLVLMVPLAVTSTDKMLARLGPKNWKLLHRLAYVVTALGVLHYYLLVKSDVRVPLAFAVIVGALLGYRLIAKVANQLTQPRTRRSAPPKPAPLKPAMFRGDLRVSAIFQETPTVKTFRFTSPTGEGRPFAFRAGQFLTIAVRIEGQVHRRCYTIASSPLRSGYVEISVRRDPMGTVSRYLHDQVQVGDLLEIAGPGGKFFIDENGREAVVLIAGGVGITPVMSMLRYLTDTAWPGSITLFQASRTEADLIYDEELTYLERRHPQLKRVLVLSDEPMPRSGAHVGRLSADLLRQEVPEIARLPVYLCGPEGMMTATGELLRQLGAPAESLYTEAFGGPKTPSATVAAAALAGTPGTATATGTRTITFATSRQAIDVSPDRTILEAGEDAGVSLNWECRSGFCGQCKVRCSSGQVNYGSATALTASDRGAGYLLACQATPLSDAVVIEA